MVLVQDLLEKEEFSMQSINLQFFLKNLKVSALSLGPRKVMSVSPHYDDLQGCAR
jgi:hypothetical protein